jgi:hypothetical protein
MDINSKNVFFDKLLSDEDADTVKAIANAADKSTEYTVNSMFQFINNIVLPEEITNKIIKTCSDLVDGEELILKEYNFATYRRLEKSGKVYHPSLFPHYDYNFEESTLTLDYQIDSSLDWPITVDGKEFDLVNNSAVSFMGSHQVHWRYEKEFGPDDFVQMIFFNFGFKNPKPIDHDTIDDVKNKAKKYRDLFNNKNKG